MRCKSFFVACSILKSKTFGHRLDLECSAIRFLSMDGSATKRENFNSNMNSLRSDQLLSHSAYSPRIDAIPQFIAYDIVSYCTYRISKSLYKPILARTHTHTWINRKMYNNLNQIGKISEMPTSVNVRYIKRWASQEFGRNFCSIYAGTERETGRGQNR